MFLLLPRVKRGGAVAGDLCWRGAERLIVVAWAATIKVLLATVQVKNEL